ncbi:endo alpha-1,4 polygalactosaminidase [Streptomyces sp. NPDC057411]|uniref:endo alpha-1,4 polygalactosaminidase n=1 Tax=unclassified Streptomyces TaxID=2593676 RepID=UPI003628A985
MRRVLPSLALLLILLAACSSPPAPPAPPTPDPKPTPVWHPRPGTPWQWQLSGRLDPSVDAPVYDIDAFDHPASAVADLHRRGRKVICYVSTGAWEDFRPDAAKFPKALLGKGNGWQGERWLDIRRTDLLTPLMAARLDLCRAKGFDAVEPDNMDGYRNDTGFPLTAADQLRYNRLIARLAHARGLAVGLKNDLDQIPQLVSDFDFAVNEQCAEYAECEALTPFVKAGKAVFHVEYEREPHQFCAQSRRLGLSSMRKEYDLGAWRRAC